MRFFHCDHVEIPLPPDHKFPRGKYRLLRERLQLLHPPEMFVAADSVSWEDLERVHTPEYLEAMRAGTLSRDAIRLLGFPWSPQLVERSRRSVGGTLSAARWALERGRAANLAGGTHHAFADHGEGFCVFNDIAVAIRSLGVRAAVVDLDVHQGNGTAAIFRDDPSVFTLSLHAKHNYPFRKERSSLDVELDDGCDDATYLAALERALPEVVRFRPDLVFYIAGSDVLETDALGRLALTLDGIRARDARVLDAFDRLVMVMGGGYSKPIERSIEAHVLSYGSLTNRPSRAGASSGPP